MKQNAVFRLTKRRLCICKTPFDFRETPFSCRNRYFAIFAD